MCVCSCEPCAMSCSACTGPSVGDCVECADTFWWEIGACVQNCSDGYYGLVVEQQRLCQMYDATLLFMFSLYLARPACLTERFQTHTLKHNECHWAPLCLVSLISRLKYHCLELLSSSSSRSNSVSISCDCGTKDVKPHSLN